MFKQAYENSDQELEIWQISVVFVGQWQVRLSEMIKRIFKKKIKNTFGHDCIHVGYILII